MCLRIRAACALLLMSSGCSRDSGYGGEYMLDQASGVELGMTFAEVQEARGRVIVDENGVWESLDRFRSTSFVFGAGPVWRGSLNSLEAVVIDRLMPGTDTIQRRRTHDSIRAVWNHAAGPPTDSLQFWSPSFSPEQANLMKLVTWCSPDALLLLIYEVDHGIHRGRSSMVRAIIQNPNFKLAHGYGIPYQQMRCPRKTPAGSL